MRAGRRDKALGILQQWQLSDARPLVRLARTYACLGDQEQALDHLEKWATQNPPGLAEMLQAPELAAMRTNPRVRGVAEAGQPDAVTVGGGS